MVPARVGHRRRSDSGVVRQEREPPRARVPCVLSERAQERDNGEQWKGGPETSSDPNFRSRRKTIDANTLSYLIKKGSKFILTIVTPVLFRPKFFFFFFP